MICLNRHFIALLRRVLFQFENIPSAPRLALYYLTSQIRDCWNYQERFRLKRWGEEVIHDHFSLVKKKIDKIERIVPKKTHYLYLDTKRYNMATIFKWAIRPENCHLDYKKDCTPNLLVGLQMFLCFMLEKIRKHGKVKGILTPCFVVFFCFVYHFPNIKREWACPTYNLEPAWLEIIYTHSNCTYSLKVTIVYYWSYF